MTPRSLSLSRPRTAKPGAERRFIHSEGPTQLCVIIWGSGGGDNAERGHSRDLCFVCGMTCGVSICGVRGKNERSCSFPRPGVGRRLI